MTASTSQSSQSTRMKVAIVVALAAVVSLGAGLYTYLPGWVASQVHLRPATMVLKPDLSGDTGTILARLLRGRLKVRGEAWVDNQTWFDISIDRLTWAAFLKGRKVAEGTIQPGPTLLSDREDKVAFGADVLLASLGLAAVDVLKVGSADVHVDVSYTASALGMSFSNAVRLSGFDLRMDAKQIPFDQLAHESPAAPETAAASALPRPRSDPTGGASPKPKRASP